MLAVLSVLFSGLIFGIGLSLAGMLDPTKVTSFLNILGKWDPSLGFVMSVSYTHLRAHET